MQQNMPGRFQHEAAGPPARLDHPNIIKVLDYGTLEDGTEYMVQEYFEGAVDLKEERQAGRLTNEEIFYISCMMMKGLNYCHQQGIIHRDIKPDNILYNPQTKEVKLIDLGIAKSQEQKMDNTRTGQLFGTPTYMPPEQITGAKNATSASDLYSLATMAAYLIAGEPPRPDTVDKVLIRTLRPAPAAARSASWPEP